MSYSYRKSNVTGGSWSTPFNTPFFARYGESSIKVPIAALLEEYNAWEKSRVTDDSARELPPVVKPSAADDPFASSGPIDWADEVEQELFSDWTTPDHTDSKPDGEELDDPTDDILFIVPIEDRRFAERDSGFTLFRILQEAEVEETDGVKLTVAEADSTPTNLTDPTPPTPPTPSTDFMPLAPSTDLGLATASTSTSTDIDSDSDTDTDIDTDIDTDRPVFQILNCNATHNGVNIDTLDIDDPDFDPANEFCTMLQYLSATGLLRLDTYATIFDAAARHCASGHPFWLNERPAPSVIVL
ncbi:hypothetical protein DICSQDRAFT_168958 [Dichomitus squalens LYAD-421 SS1]|uniref:uncharacterized protein n=1 Tax=Dichomitus squalens (strain LYAD-421) TaxID=732165 RepID=UPI000441137E|nr:uncharacterized protein DICSQDRAFT_168958 [Dichomitus squalens LYAD-421 SS1]EJF62567.1 hypothetical protein DICSQDRAFT_168958 [Dichomitus squalens LYAD-421 SS1]